MKVGVFRRLDEKPEELLEEVQTFAEFLRYRRQGWVTRWSRQHNRLLCRVLPHVFYGCSSLTRLVKMAMTSLGLPVEMGWLQSLGSA